MDTYSRICRRAGCTFVSTRRADGKGWKPHCSFPCRIVDVRARKVAVQSGPNADAEAADVLRQMALLDGRETPHDWVDGLFADERA